LPTKDKTPTASLQRTERVRRRPEFERAYDTGVRINGRYMTVFVVANGGQAPRLGVAATRKIGGTRSTPAWM